MQTHNHNIDQQDELNPKEVQSTLSTYLLPVTLRHNITVWVKQLLNYADPVGGLAKYKVYMKSPEELTGQANPEILSFEMDKNFASQPRLATVIDKELDKPYAGSGGKTLRQYLFEDEIKKREQVLRTQFNPKASKIDAAQIPEEWRALVFDIQKVAKENHIEAYISGGFVRDIMMNPPRAPKDLDITTVGEGSGIKFAQLLAKDLGGTEPKLFPNTGTAQTVVRGKELEIAMARKESYRGGYHIPEVVPGTNEEDTLRRDTSINSMKIKLDDMEFLDLSGHGLSDLKEGVLRAPVAGKEDQLFEEDPTRILRVIQQSLTLGFPISEEMEKAMKRNSNRLEIKLEETKMKEGDRGLHPSSYIKILTRIFGHRDLDRAINKFKEIGIMKHLLPEMEDAYGFEQPSEHHDYDVYNHLLNAVKNVQRYEKSDDQMVANLIALLHDIGKPSTMKEHGTFHGHDDKSAEMANTMLKRLNIPEDVIKRVVRGIKNHMRTHNYNEEEWSNSAVRRYVRDSGDDLHIALGQPEADIRGSRKNIKQDDLDNLQKLRDRIKRLEEEHPTSKAMVPKIDGNQLMQAYGRPGGKWVGLVHQHLIEKQLEKPDATEGEAWIWVDEFLKDNPGIFERKSWLEEIK